MRSTVSPCPCSLNFINSAGAGVQPYKTLLLLVLCGSPCAQGIEAPESFSHSSTNLRSLLISMGIFNFQSIENNVFFHSTTTALRSKSNQRQPFFHLRQSSIKQFGFNVPPPPSPAGLNCQRRNNPSPAASTIAHHNRHAKFSILNINFYVRRSSKAQIIHE
jgi:hypothetical protein